MIDLIDSIELYAHDWSWNSIDIGSISAMYVLLLLSDYKFHREDFIVRRKWTVFKKELQQKH